MSQFALHIHQDGNHEEILFDGLDRTLGENEFIWVNLNPKDETSKQLLFDEFELDSSLKDVLFSNTQRPRLELFDDHIFISIRGVNYSSEEDHEDMISLRILLFQNAIITLHTRDMKSIAQMKKSLEENHKYSSATQFLIQLISTLNTLISTEVENLNERVTLLEEASLTDDIEIYQDPLSEIRRTLLGYQKYLLPQASVLQKLWEVNTKWFKKRERTLLKNQAEKTSSLFAELEHLRQRSSVLQEEIKSALSERMNQSMYRLTIVATIMLPLGLFAGLMGANVGGMPFSNSSYGFLIICLMCFGLGTGVFALLKYMKWI
jgi:zinc transporter